MYLKYFNLKTKPFEISPDPRFLWLGEKHKEGLASLKYGILTGKGFMSLTGDVGTGKTTLLNALAKSFDDNFIFARIPDPSLEELDFFNFAASAFEMEKRFRGKGDFLSALTVFLNIAYTDNKIVILIVDEAQIIKQELLEDIRLISNIEKPDKKLINIIFAGQNNFNDVLAKNGALRNRLSIHYQIEPLTEIETEAYITHRLKIAGSKIRIFSSSAIHEIYKYSKGNPRQINIICDLALLHGYTAETGKIEPAIIKECVKNTLISIPSIKPEATADDQRLRTIEPIELNQEKPLEDMSRPWNSNFHRIKSTFSLSKTAFLAPIPLIILVCLIGLIFYPDNFNTSILNIKSYVDQAVIRYINPMHEGSLHNAQVANLPTSPQSDPTPRVLAKNLQNKEGSNDHLTEELTAQAGIIADLQNKLEKAQAEKSKLKKHLHISRQATALLKTQVKELHSQKASAETRLANLQTAHDTLAADFKQLKNTQAQDAELKNALAAKDRLIRQSEQRQQELEKNLAQANSSKDKLDRELLTQTARVADLQNNLDTARGEQAALKAQLQKSRQETALVRAQLQDLGTQKAASDDQLSNLKSAHSALSADFEELKTAQAQVAELKETLAAKDRMLTQSEQRQQELTKELEQTNNSKDQLDSELSAQTARVADLQNKLDTAGDEQAALNAQLQKRQQESALIETQLAELRTQKAASDDQLANLQMTHRTLAADFEELKTTKAQVVELKEALAAKDRLIRQSEQRQQELAQDLAQANSSKDKLNDELSAQAALLADLQNNRENFQGDQAELESQLQKSRQETVLLRAQLKELNAQKVSSEAQFKNLQIAHRALAADFEELKTAQEQVAELKESLAAKDRMLAQSEQRQQELAKELEQATDSKDKLDRDLSAQAARLADLQKKQESFRGDQTELESQLQRSRQETVLLRAQLKELNAQKVSSESQFKNLQTAHRVLAADFEELKTAQVQVAELKEALAAKDRMLMQNEQRQHELAKELEQATNGKDKLDRKLSAQAALIADLQNKLESFRGDRAAFEAKLQKNRQETALIQTQLNNLKAKTSASPVRSAALDMQKKSPSEIEPPEEETEAPNPADIIDWVLKKKSE